MSSYRIQLQRGLSLSEFLDRFVSEKQGIEQLMRQRWLGGFSCAHCAGREPLACWSSRYARAARALSSGAFFRSWRPPGQELMDQLAVRLDDRLHLGLVLLHEGPVG